MSVFVLMLWFSVNTGSLIAQKTLTVQGIEFNYREVPVYHPGSESDLSIRLELAYGTDVVTDPESWNDRWRGTKIPYEVNFVYSKFPADTAKWGKPHHELVSKRMTTLLKFDPTLKDAKDVDWNLILQTACKTEAEAKKLFHGFIIKYYYDPKKLSESVKPFLDKIEQEDRQTYEGLTDEQIQVYVNYVWGLIANWKESDTSPEDSSVITVLQKHPEWKNALVVIDLTGSMYPYTGQVFRWLNRKSGNIKHIALFNDGDGELKKYTQPDESDKPIGNTGGIYYAEPNNRSFQRAVFSCVSNGCGDWNPENNLEAVIKAMAKYKGDFQDVILIADGNAPVRDISLLSKITKPLHIIVCRKEYCPDPTYITVAVNTKGSLHTMDAELDFTHTDLVTLFKDGSIKFDDCLYELVDKKTGKIKNTKKMKKGKSLFRMIVDALNDMDRKLKEKHKKRKK